MNEIQVFGFEGNEVRTVSIDGEPWFVLKDVCDALSISNSRDTADRLDSDEKNTVALNDGTAGNPNRTIINESGLYNVILRSDKPEAKRFKKWVTSEVLPSIRKKGGYLSPTVDFSDPDVIRRLLDSWAEDRKKLNEAQAKVALDAPKVEFFNAVADSKDAIEMKDVAKVLAINGLGRNNLFELLRNQKVLMANNTPYQMFVDKGYFRVIEQKYTNGFGEPCVNLKTLVYQKGVDFIRKLVLRVMAQEE